MYHTKRNLQGDGWQPWHHPSSYHNLLAGCGLSCRSGKTTGVFLEEGDRHWVEWWGRQVVERHRGRYLMEKIVKNLAKQKVTSNQLKNVFLSVKTSSYLYHIVADFCLLTGHVEFWFWECVIYSHIGLLPGPERVPGISCPFWSTHQQYPELPWHCIGS